jgi:iron uptake system component EfeO
VLASAFLDEDMAIDARPYAFPDGGDQNPDFKGNHKIERFLYRDMNLTAAEPFAEELQRTFANLTVKLNDSSLYNSYISFSGMLSLATEVSNPRTLSPKCATRSARCDHSR